jgi:type I restriction enzyme S subunit
VAKIEESFSLIEKTENLIDSLFLQNNLMRNSILSQAFKGKLVPQDLSDESAEILLQKIKLEKQKIISQTTKPRKKNDK